MSRLSLHEELCSLLGSRNVYFQPPESIKMHYPCFIYDLRLIGTRKADDDIYQINDSYTVKYVTSDPDSEMKHGFLRAFRYAAFDRVYKADNLYHYVYTLYHN